jgi:hypothetical protein
MATGPNDILGEPPRDFGEPFLHWLRDATERAWADVDDGTLADFVRARVGGSRWRRGTRWTGGLSESQIDDVAKRFGLAFPAQHRLFLRSLHSTTPRCVCARFVGSELKGGDCPGFFDWLRDGRDIRDALDTVVDGLVFDVEQNHLWPDGWGARPASSEERCGHVQELVARAPRLIPLFSHRFMISGELPLVLSIHQSDTIVYGCDLRAYLLHELHELLGLERDPRWMDADASAVPFWGDLAAQLEGS